MWGAIAGAVAGAALSRRGGSQSSSTKPWSEQRPFLRDIYGQAQELSGRNVPFFPGQTYAESNPLHDIGFGGQMDVAQRYGGLTGRAGRNVFGLADYTTGGLGEIPTVDPSQRLTQQLSGEVDLGAYNPVADALRRQTMRSVDQQMVPEDQLAASMGQSGSSRHGVAEGILRRGAQDSLTDALASMYLGAHEGAQNRATQGVSQAADLFGRSSAADLSRLGTAADLYGMIPQFGQSRLAFAGVPLAAGDFYRQEEQMGIDDARQRYEYEAEQPWSNLERYANLIYGSPGGSQMTVQTPGNMFGGAMGGAMMGSQLQNMFSEGSK